MDSLPPPDVDAPVGARRTQRRWFLVLAPVLITVVLGAVVGGFVVVQSLNQAERVEAADAIGADYLSEVATFRQGVADALADADPEPGPLLTALEASTADPPRLRETDAAGSEQSATYAEAADVAETLLEPYEALGDELARAQEGLAFVEAARQVLALRASDYVDGSLLSSSAQVRQSLIPAFVSARDELAAVDVPEGQEELAATVTSAVQTVIDRATALAASIEGNRAYTFSYADVYQDAITAVEDYATQVEGDLTEALNTVTDLQDA